MHAVCIGVPRQRYNIMITLLPAAAQPDDGSESGSGNIDGDIGSESGGGGGDMGEQVIDLNSYVIRSVQMDCRN